MQVSLLDLKIGDTCDGMDFIQLTYLMLLHYLVKVKTPEKNVILQWDITKENCIRCIIASSKWTRVIMCLTLTYLECYTAKRV